MGRKVIVIDGTKCPYFLESMKTLSFRLDFHGKITINFPNVYGLKGDISKLISDIIHIDLISGKEIFGDNYQTPAEVQKQIEYLQSLIK